MSGFPFFISDEHRSKIPFLHVQARKTWLSLPAFCAVIGPKHMDRQKVPPSKRELSHKCPHPIHTSLRSPRPLPSKGWQALQWAQRLQGSLAPQFSLFFHLVFSGFVFFFAFSVALHSELAHFWPFLYCLALASCTRSLSLCLCVSVGQKWSTWQIWALICLREACLQSACRPSNLAAIQTNALWCQLTNPSAFSWHSFIFYSFPSSIPIIFSWWVDQPFCAARKIQRVATLITLIKSN